MYIIVLLLLILIMFKAADSSCPRLCSSHGSCNSNNVCKCDSQWNYYPDCSGRVCPSGLAWADKASTENNAHQNVECSNRGLCDRSTGVCDCLAGFEGSACERTQCSHSLSQRCSGHGQCLSTSILFDIYTPGSVAGQYSSWDGTHTTACSCDYGYTGTDCSMRMCPKGDDPLTPFSDYRTITIATTAASGSLGGAFKFSFADQSFTFPGDARSWTSSDCTTSFQSNLQNVKAVSCTRLSTDARLGGTWKVQVIRIIFRLIETSASIINFIVFLFCFFNFFLFFCLLN